ncbi:MAG TPA: hypothetical protein VKD66_03400, partial [Streptosporangiaceae bacterium]|nr:hypothetical protein [Streptosporangiaceae bacterium]
GNAETSLSRYTARGRTLASFGLYETWVDLAAVEEHESGADFKAYKEQLRPLVESGSVLFGDAEPLAVLGYPFPGGGEAR